MADPVLDVQGLMTRMPLAVTGTPHLLMVSRVPISPPGAEPVEAPMLFTWTSHSMDYLLLDPDEAVAIGLHLADAGRHCGGKEPAPDPEPGTPPDLSVVRAPLLGPNGVPLG